MGLDFLITHGLNGNRYSRIIALFCIINVYFVICGDCHLEAPNLFQMVLLTYEQIVHAGSTVSQENVINQHDENFLRMEGSMPIEEYLVLELVTTLAFVKSLYSGIEMGIKKDEDKIAIKERVDIIQGRIDNGVKLLEAMKAQRLVHEAEAAAKVAVKNNPKSRRRQGKK